jgi:hypothetical protein
MNERLFTTKRPRKNEESMRLIRDVRKTALKAARAG